MTKHEAQELKMRLAQQCLESGKSPIFMINFDPDNAILSYSGHMKPEDVQPGMRIHIKNIRHYDSTVIKDDGTIVPNVQAVSYENGVFIVESRSTFICNIDFEKEYKELAREKELSKHGLNSLKQTVNGKSERDVIAALRQRYKDENMRPILMTDVRWTTLYGNHNSSNELAEYLSLDKIEPGMRVYLSCNMIDMETGEALNQSGGEICIPHVADVCVYDGHLFIESSNGNLITTLDLRDRELILEQRQSGVEDQSEFESPEIGE